MRSILTFTIFIVLSSSAICQNPTSIIRAAITEQQKAWNNGDIEGFMEHYWNDPQMMFVSKNGVTMGWRSTLENYKMSYPTKEAMGTLGFELNELRQLSNEAVLVIGAWLLKYPDKESVGGSFNLLWEMKNGRWVITIDHTS